MYQVFSDDRNLFDFSNYPKSHLCYDLTNKKVIGKFKDELGGDHLREFIGLKAKMYTMYYHTYDKKQRKVVPIESKKAKGVKKATLKNRVTHDDYKSTLLEMSTVSTRFNSIRSFKHVLYTIEQNKKSLSSFDDKRYILDDGIHTLAHGHYSLRN